MTRIAISCGFVALVLCPASVSRAEDSAARFPELTLGVVSGPSSATSNYPAPSMSAFASTKSSLHVSSHPLASTTFAVPSATRPAALAAYSPYSPLVGLSDDVRTALPTSGHYNSGHYNSGHYSSDVLRTPAAPSTATSSLIHPLAIPSIGGSDSSYFRESSAPFGAAFANQPVGFSYR